MSVKPRRKRGHANDRGTKVNRAWTPPPMMTEMMSSVKLQTTASALAVAIVQSKKSIRIVTPLSRSCMTRRDPRISSKDISTGARTGPIQTTGMRKRTSQVRTDSG